MKKPIYIVLGIVAILIITNPSISAFKAYIGSNTYLGLRRSENLFVCSTFNKSGLNYFGMIGNFWELNKPEAPKITDFEKERLLDSAQMSDSSRHTSDGLPILRKN